MKNETLKRKNFNKIISKEGPGNNYAARRICLRSTMAELLYLSHYMDNLKAVVSSWGEPEWSIGRNEISTFKAAASRTSSVERY